MADLSDESMALTRRGDPGINTSASFTQQGTVDWTRLAGGGFSVSLDIVRRISSAGLEPFTVAVAQQICRSLPLGPAGEKRLQECLSQLRSFSSFGDMIWLGFGVRHILRTLVQTSEGASAVALCASLTEVHSPEVSTLVMIELAKRHKTPVDLMPSFVQWQTFIEACGGVLKPSSFALKVQMILALSRPKKNPIYGHEYHVSLPSDMAEVLEGVAKLRSGTLRRITVIGGPACAWLAVFVDWILGLAVQVRAEDDTVIYSNFDEKRHSAQVIVKFNENGEELGLKQIEETFALRNGNSLIMRQLAPGRQNYELLRLNNCVPWETALTSTFGRKAANLLHGNKGWYLLQAISAAGDALADGKCHEQGLRYGQGGVRRGAFLVNAQRWFPELQQLPDIGETFMCTPIPEEPSARYEYFMQALRASCECRFCQQDTTAVGGNHGDVCSLALALMICLVSHELAQLEMETNLSPTASGLWYLYERIQDLLKRPFVEQVTVVLEKLFNGLIITDEPDPLKHSMWLFSILFAGFRFRSLIDVDIDQVVAVAEAGICIYSGVLLGLIDRYDLVGKIHITAGVIGIGAKHYEHISCAPFSKELETNTEQLSIWTSSDINPVLSRRPKELEIELMVDVLHRLAAGYCVSNKDARFWINPWRFVTKTLPAASKHTKYELLL
ncbi:MAG: hypothetical protein M1816_007430 [Peltula sp. TS41687]|nr:MAG: hypothetical protein M1816_007430 [Peltula sp. TS41687]